MDEKVLPDSENLARYNEYYKLYHYIYKSLKHDMSKMSDLNNF